MYFSPSPDIFYRALHSEFLIIVIPNACKVDQYCPRYRLHTLVSWLSNNNLEILSPKISRWRINSSIQLILAAIDERKYMTLWNNCLIRKQIKAK